MEHATSWKLLFVKEGLDCAILGLLMTILESFQWSNFNAIFSFYVAYLFLLEPTMFRCPRQYSSFLVGVFAVSPARIRDPPFFCAFDRRVRVIFFVVPYVWMLLIETYFASLSAASLLPVVLAVQYTARTSQKGVLEKEALFASSSSFINVTTKMTWRGLHMSVERTGRTEGRKFLLETQRMHQIQSS